MSQIFEVEIDQNAIDRAEKRLSEIPKGFEKAASRALNRAASSGRTAAVSEIRRTYTVKAGTVRSDFSISRAGTGALETTVTAKGPMLPLSSFRVSPKTDTTGSRRTKVRASVLKGGLKPIGQAFIHRGRVLQRLGSTRLPVEEKYGPAVPIMADHDAVRDKVEEVMSETFIKRLDHETEYLLSKE